MSYIDLAIIAIVALGALIGLWKGFFKTLISFFGWFVSFLVAFFITKPVVGALMDIGNIRTFVVGNGENWSLFSWIFKKLPDLSSGGVLGMLLSPLISLAETVNGADVQTSVALLLANGIFSIIVCIGLLIVIRFILLLFTMFANAMTRNRFVGALNRLLGLALGAVKGALFVVVAMFIMSFMMGFGFMSPVREQMDNSVIAAPVYKQVVKFTDDFVTGGKDTLIKLLDIYDRNTGKEEPPAALPEHGEYTSVEDGSTFSIELSAEGRFTQYSSGSQRTGTYTISENTLTLRFIDNGEVVVAEINVEDKWIKLGEIYLVKEGATPPESGGPEAPPAGGEEPDPGPGGEEETPEVSVLAF